VPLRDDHGKVIGIAGINRDITERKRMEDQLRESESRYGTLFDSTNDVILIHDMGGKFFDVNKVACDASATAAKSSYRMTPAIRTSDYSFSHFPITDLATELSPLSHPLPSYLSQTDSSGRRGVLRRDPYPMPGRSTARNRIEKWQEKVAKLLVRPDVWIRGVKSLTSRNVGPRKVVSFH
jgi:hypothetical protein